MQMSPTPPPSRRSRAKSTNDSATVTPKKPRARKASAKPAAASKADTIDIVALQPDPTELQDRIATTAYFLAAERNFEPGQELADWLEAERRVRDRYT